MSLPLFVALLVLCCGYAAWRGGAPERLAAGLQVAAFLLTLLVHRSLEGTSFASANVATMAVDGLLLVALTILAWRSTRYWPLWIAGWQCAATVGHLAKAIAPAMHVTAYAIQAQIWAYPMLLATAAGAWRYRARRRRGVVEPDWKPDPRWA